MSDLGVAELVRYNISMVNGDKELVEGYRVGRFAVRQNGNVWQVDHIATGLLLLGDLDYQTAVSVADDASRFSKQDPASKDAARASQQIGETVKRWIVEQSARQRRGEPVLSYREFYGAPEKQGRRRARREAW